MNNPTHQLLINESLSRLSKTEVDYRDLLTEEDTQVLDKLTQQYKSVRNHLVKALAHFEERHSNVPFPSKISQRPNGEYYLSPHPERQRMYRYLYDVAEDVVKTKEKIRGLNRYYSNEVARYLNSTYTLTVSFKTEEEELTLEALIDSARQQCNGIAFNQRGAENIKNNFSKSVYQPVKIKNNKVILTDHFYVTDWISDTYYIDDIQKVNALHQAMCFFETGLVENEQDPFPAMVGRDRSRETDMFELVTFDTQKITALKYYKNGRVDLSFDSHYRATEFVKLFNLSC